MAKNRKMQSVANRFGPALKAFLLCLLIGGSGVGYVWQKDQLTRLGQQIKKREQRLADLDEQNEKLKKQLATMRSPRFLEMRIKELSLGLVPPQPNQVWRMAEPLRDQPPAAPAVPEAERQYARVTGLTRN
jgi:cell division protein FtsB